MPFLKNIKLVIVYIITNKRLYPIKKLVSLFIGNIMLSRSKYPKHIAPTKTKFITKTLLSIISFLVFLNGKAVIKIITILIIDVDIAIYPFILIIVFSNVKLSNIPKTISTKNIMYINDIIKSSSFLLLL